MFRTPDVARVMQRLEDVSDTSDTLFAPERSQPTIDKLPGDWIMHRETWARSFRDDNPNARQFSCIVVSSQSHEYSLSAGN